MEEEIETLRILDEVETLVSDKLQVVSYKWLSRNFLVSSNAAKRLLQEIVEKSGSDLEVVYTLSGWLKDNPSIYHIRLVSRPKLGEAKQEFDDNCSVQVYSVQACIPKDPASLWNAEFEQAEELFKQPPTVDNCLRDNRFCGVSNSYVKRNVEGTLSSASLAKSSRFAGPTRTDSVHQTATLPQLQQKACQQLSPKSSMQIHNEVKDVTGASRGTTAREQASRPATEVEKVLQVPADKKARQNDKAASETGGSLATMWGRVSSKSKPTGIPETNHSNPTASVEGGSSDDDDINFKRASNGEGSRKRRVIFDFSDDEDEFRDAVNLASPDPPKKKDSNQCSKAQLVEKSSLNFNEHKESKAKVKEDNDIKKEPNQGKINGMSLDKAICHDPDNNAYNKNKATGATLNSSTVSKDKNGGVTFSSKMSNHTEGVADATDKVTAAPNSPKRRKVLKTRIDERGREVTEVVWEGDDSETKANAMKNADSNTVNIDNRPPAAKKSPAFGTIAQSNPVGKAGNKKGGNKDPKQGNILSFFKKV